MIRLIIIIFVLLLGCPSFAVDAVFGNTATETSAGHIGNRQRGILASTGSPGGTLDSMKVYLASGNIFPVKCACFSSDGSTFIDSTEIITPSGSAEWQKLDFIQTASVSTSTAYTIWCWSSTASNLMVDDPFVGFTRYTNTGRSYGAWQATISLNNPSTGEAYSIHAWYTESGAPAPGLPRRRRRMMMELGTFTYEINDFVGIDFELTETSSVLLAAMSMRDVMILGSPPTER